MQDRYCHSSSILVKVPFDAAFRIMADGIEQGRWALGSWQRKQVEPNLFVGESVFDKKQTYVLITADATRGTIDYQVGRSREALRFRNAARVFRGEDFDYPAGTSLVTLWTWRLGSQSDDAWDQISVTHEAEMFLIRQLLEAASS